MIDRILNSKTKSVTFTAVLLSVSALISRLLGLFRDNLLANIFSKGETDIYFAAFRIPDFLYGILITGGIIAAFLPVFAESFKEDPEKAKKLTKNILGFFLLGLVGISIILFIFTPQLLDVITPGFSEAQKSIAAVLTRIMFLSPILLGASAVFSGVLQYFNLFFAYALAPLFYNGGIIIGILVFAPHFGLKGLAFGVILGAFLHALIQIPPLLKHGFKPGLSFDLNFPGMRKIMRLAAPRTLGAAAYHVNLIVVTAIASTLPLGSISVFNFANNLQHVPIGLIGTSFAVASFPELSRNFADKNREKFIKNFTDIFNQILYLIIPLSAIIFLLRAQLVRLILGTSILEGGSFGWLQTRLTAASLGIFTFSLFAAALVPYLSRVFFSLHDTKTPVKIALFSMFLNVGLCFLLVWLLGFPNAVSNFIASFLKIESISSFSVVGLVLGLSLSIIVQFVLLIFFLKKRIDLLNYKRVWRTLKKIILSTFFSGVIVYGVLGGFVLLGGITHTVAGLLFQTVVAGILGVASYVLFSHIFGIREHKKIISSIFSQFKEN